MFKCRDCGHEKDLIEDKNSIELVNIEICPECESPVKLTFAQVISLPESEVKQN